MSSYTILKAIVILVLAIVFSMLIYVLWKPLDNSANIDDFYSSNLGAGPDAAAWGRDGSYFNWQSSQLVNSHSPELNIFLPHIRKQKKSRYCYDSWLDNK
jgi:hypothetical protein